MGKLKILFQQVFMISTGILFIIGINGVVTHLTGKDFHFEWYHPLSIILLGILCALPTFVFILKEWGGKNHFILNLVLHFLSIWIITSIVGCISKWYTTWGEFLQITIECIVIYIFVWVASRWLLRAEDKKINQALKDIQDEE